ncbi:oligosaccharide flippase family protein [Pasteurella sp. PK-2025]|uniref:oligosaccharide flippase family protein n=1 Tax=Pasteurella sp. PK-2025 TaxID=3413133 RepID=UPI003C777656
MIIKNTLLLTISHILSRGSLILSSIFVSSLMDKENFSIYSYFILTSTTISIYSALGIGITTSKSYTNFSKKVNDADSPIMTIWILNIIISILGGLLFILFSEKIIPNSINLKSIYFSCLIIIMCIDIYASNALIGLEKYISLCISAFIFLIATLIAVYLSIVNNNIYYAIIGLIISSALQLILHYAFLFIYLLKTNHLKKIKIKLEHFKEIFKTMGPMMFVSLFAASTTWIVGQYILSSEDNISLEFNLFSIGLQWFSLAVFLPSVFSRVLLNYFITHSHKDTLTIAKKNIYFIMSLFLLLSVLSYFLFPLIEKIYSKYNIPIILIPIFILTAGINSSSNILGNILISRNKEWSWLIIVMSGFIVMNICCLVSEKIDSIQGAIFILANNIIILLISTLFFIKRNKKEELN